VIKYLTEINILKRNLDCADCNFPCLFRRYTRSCEGYAWRCIYVKRRNYIKYRSIKAVLFFAGFNSSIKDIMRFIIRYSCFQQLYNIKETFDISDRTIDRIYEKLISLVPEPNFEKNKLVNMVSWYKSTKQC
ncbi:hypothetical protein H312_00390, partial [Anncaliia algerae PRA339]